MKNAKMRKVLSLLMIPVLLLTMAPATPQVQAEDTLSTNVTVPFTSTTKIPNPSTGGTTTSNSYRIPAMVTLKDGTILAAADARWNTTYDGGGLDTLVARSTDGGVSWEYTMANYLGDNGNVYNGTQSTCFIDPCLTVAADGQTVYMLCDLYPYGVALNGSKDTAPSTAVGFTSEGYLKLSDNDHISYGYYLKDGKIYSSAGAEVSDYTVDGYFNLYQNDTKISNLFFADSPYKVVRTGFLYLTKSTDGGKSWSEPTLLNLKTSSEQVCLVGPGRGITTKSGTMVFPVYSFHGDNAATSNSQRLSFVYSSDGENWSRTEEFNHNWASEAAVVELSDGTLRFFFRNGTTNLCYVDYSLSNHTWGSAVTMSNIDTNSNTQISAITYSKTANGKQVILVSCPTGYNRAGANDSGAGYRLNGSIFVFTVDGKTMNLEKTIEVNSGNSQFMYSCLTERSDGSVAILFEDKESAWGTGDYCYYTMDMKAYPASELGLTFDEGSAEPDAPSSEVTANGVTVSSNKVAFTGISVTMDTKPAASYIQNAMAYYVSVQTAGGTYTGSAEVTIDLPSGWNTDKVFGYVKEADGTVTVLAGYAENGKFTFRTSGLPEVGIFEATDMDAVTNVKVIMDLGETFRPITVSDSSLVGSAGTYMSTDGTVRYAIGHTQVSGNEYQQFTGEIISGSQYLIMANSNYAVYTASSSVNDWGVNSLPIRYIYMYNGADLSSYLWTITGVNGGYYIQNSKNQYMNISTTNKDSRGNYTVTLSDAPVICDISRSGNYYKIFADGTYIGLNNAGGANQTALGWYDTNNTPWQLYRLLSEDSTNVVFTGLNATSGTDVQIGNTTYTVVVETKDAKVSETLQLNSSETLNALATLGLSGSNYDVTYTKTADANNVITLSGNVITTLDRTGSATVVATVTNEAGETVGTVTYTITVTDIVITDTKNIYVPVGGTAIIEGLTGDIHTGMFAESTATYSVDGNQAITFTGVAVGRTALVVGQTQINVFVNPKNTGSGANTKKYLYVNVLNIEHCTVYCSINGSDLIEIQGEGVLIDQTYTDGMVLILFAAPEEGYALTQMLGSNIYVTDGTKNPKPVDGAFFALRNGKNADGEVDVTLGDAWPLNEDGSYKAHGWQWMLKEGNISKERLQEVMEAAAALGCDGASVITRNNTTGTSVNTEEDMDWEDVAVNFSFVAERLPTFDKTIVSVNGQPYTENTIIEFGDEITYRFTITSNSEKVLYTAVTIRDDLIGFVHTVPAGRLDTAGSYSVTAVYTVNVGDVDKYVGGQFHNKAHLTYEYSSDYYTGSYEFTDSASVSCDISGMVYYTWADNVPLEIAGNADVYPLPGQAVVTYNTPFRVQTYTGATEYVAMENGVAVGKWVFKCWNLAGTEYTGGETVTMTSEGSLAFEGIWEYTPYPTYTVTYQWVGAPGRGVTLPVDGGNYYSGQTYLVDGVYKGGDTCTVDGVAYTFGGWKLDGRVVSGQQTIGQGNVTLVGVWTSSQLYTSLVIRKTGIQAIDANQTSLFRIQGEGVDLTVAVHGDGYVVVDGLKVGGTYTVTEIIRWSWRYDFASYTTDLPNTAAEHGATITLGAEKNEIAFTSQRIVNWWLDGNHWIDNTFAGKS